MKGKGRIFGAGYLKGQGQGYYNYSKLIYSGGGVAYVK